MVNLKNDKPLYKQLKDEITQQISQGVYKVGDRILSEHKLSTEYNVSLITVRRAIADLVHEGVLFRRQGQGTFIAEPSISEQGLGTVGIVLKNLDNLFSTAILRGAEVAAKENNCALMFSTTEKPLENEERQVAFFRDKGVRGLLIFSRFEETAKYMKDLQDDNFPFVMISYIDDENIDCVSVDDVRGGFIGTEHLVKTGLRRIAYVGVGDPVSRNRIKGYRKALEKYGIKFDPSLIIPHFDILDDTESFFRNKDEVISRLKDIEAIFAYNDGLARKLYRALTEARLRVPADIAIVGFDDIGFEQNLDIPLSTVAQPTFEIGKIAFRTLFKKVTRELSGPQRVFLEPKLIIRGTCGCAKNL